ncbi:hypothetical protein [Gulosibacter sp. ACHW.36C]|uniref:hypothetical protein n=1 Tax=Gulosibacter sp. ACHW.36C TaxID=3434457 RepID=UPI003D663361
MSNDNELDEEYGGDAHLTNAAIDVHADDPAFGFRFIADEFAENGFTASVRCVWWR